MTMRRIPFTKASACGNDFLVIGGADAPADWRDLSRRICDRHNGIGADGVEWLFPGPEGKGFRIHLINADGSEAEISGNGTRCVAAYLASQGAESPIEILTGAGLKRCDLAAREEDRFEFETDMGQPRVDDDVSLRLGAGEVRGTPVSMGNPHYVVFVSRFPPEWRDQAREIGGRPEFKQGVNVEFARVNSASEIEVLFYERGVGETQSSGTGSCAAAAAAMARGLAQSPVVVRAPGGTQSVRWMGNSIFLRGPARLVGQGEFFDAP